jgi:hypothetical protein
MKSKSRNFGGSLVDDVGNPIHNFVRVGHSSNSHSSKCKASIYLPRLYSLRSGLFMPSGMLLHDGVFYFG